MQSALALDSDANPSGLELVTTPAVAPSGPEQLPLIRMLEVVRDRVDSLHAGQRTLTAEVREIRASLPQQRKPLSKRSQEVHIRATWARRNGLCPCCQETPVCDSAGRLDEAEYDHWYGRNQNRVTQTWLVCSACNQRLNDTDFKASVRSAFESYQQAVRPFMSGRQLPLGLRFPSKKAKGARYVEVFIYVNTGDRRSAHSTSKGGRPLRSQRNHALTTSV